MEDDNRVNLINRAIEKYVASGLTRNITDALRMFLEHDAGPDDQVQIFITAPRIDRLKAMLKKIRPRCDDCENELRLKIDAMAPDGKTYPTAWLCDKCGLEEYSNKTPEDWLKVLQDEDRTQTI